MSGARSKTGFLIKHLPAGTTTNELREMFEKYGTIGRLLLPPQGLTAMIEYSDATEARTAFRTLAYTKVTCCQTSSILIVIDHPLSIVVFMYIFAVISLRVCVQHDSD